MNVYLSNLTGSTIENNLTLVNNISDDLNTLIPNNIDIVNTSNLFNLIYPIGSIYMSINSTSPSILFGGTWTAIENTFLIAQGSQYAAGSTGGSATMEHTHILVGGISGTPSTNISGSTTLTVNLMPSHTHTQNLHRHQMVANWSSGSGSSDAYQYSGNRGTQNRYTDYQTPTINATGGGEGHTHTLSDHTHTISATVTQGASNTNNLPPYLAVYMWLRTA